MICYYLYTDEGNAEMLTKGVSKVSIARHRIRKTHITVCNKVTKPHQTFPETGSFILRKHQLNAVYLTCFKKNPRARPHPSTGPHNPNSYLSILDGLIQVCPYLTILWNNNNDNNVIRIKQTLGTGKSSSHISGVLRLASLQWAFRSKGTQPEGTTSRKYAKKIKR